MLSNNEYANEAAEAHDAHTSDSSADKTSISEPSNEISLVSTGPVNKTSHGPTRVKLRMMRFPIRLPGEPSDKPVRGHIRAHKPPVVSSLILTSAVGKSPTKQPRDVIYFFKKIPAELRERIFKLCCLPKFGSQDRFSQSRQLYRVSDLLEVFKSDVVMTNEILSCMEDVVKMNESNAMAFRNFNEACWVAFRTLDM